MAAQGLREGQDGSERIADPEVAEEVRGAGRLVNRLALVSAVIATGLAVVADLSTGLV